MGDLNAPPPSYEFAMGMPGSSNKNQYFPTAPPTAPPPDDDIVSDPITTPILPRLPQPSTVINTPTTQRTQPVYNPNFYSTNRSPLVTDHRSNEWNESENKSCVCVVLILILLTALVYIFFKVAGAGSIKPKYNQPSYKYYQDNNYNSG